MRFIVLILILLTGCAIGAEPKVFHPDYKGVLSINAVLTTDEGTIKVALDFQKAPNTVANFVELARKGFYNGLTFHRVIQGFVVQGGDPNGNGSGGPGYTIPFEANDLKHETGVIAMARSAELNSAGSQFYFTQAPQPSLDGKYVVFGRITEGLDVIYRIEQNDPIKKIEILETKAP